MSVSSDWGVFQWVTPLPPYQVHLDRSRSKWRAGNKAGGPGQV